MNPSASPSRFENLVQLLCWAAEAHAEQAWMRFHREGAWRDMSYGEAFGRIRAIAGGLAALGVEVGDRAAIMSANRPEWALADYGSLAAGAVVVSVYPTLPGHEAAYILGHSGSRVAFVEDAEQAEKLLAVRDQLPELARIVVLAGEAPAHPDILTLQALEALASPQAATERIEAVKALPPETPLAITYTSGTTGVPKGVVLTHRNLMGTMAAVREAVGPMILDFQLNLSFLPLAHALERVGGHFFPLYLGGTVAYARSLETVAEDFQAIRPQFAVVVPRVLEKIHARVMAQAERMPPWRRAIFDWALGVGKAYVLARQAGRPVHFDLALKQTLADRLVFSAIRERVGGRLTALVSGGAPLSSEIALFFHAAGLFVYEGWGATETSAPATINRPGAYRIGSVGRPLPGVEVTVAEDGELLVSGVNVFAGYFKDPEATAAAKTPDGRFRTGDIGRVDEDGFFYITDRKKELIITAAGKNIAPQKLETRLREQALVANCCVHGDRRPYLVALLTLDRQALAARHPELATASASDPAVRALVQQAIDAVNAQLPRFEQIKVFDLLEEDFSPESGELTVTLKLKRRAIEERHRARLDALYAPEAPTA